MRVVILGTRGFPRVQGGVEKHCEGLSVSLVATGCEVITFTRKPYVDKTITSFKGVRLVALPAPKNKFAENIVHTFICIIAARRFKPDIIHFQAVGSALLIPLARLLGMTVVFTTHGSNYKHLKWGLFAKLVLRLSEYMGVKFANEVIAISKTIAGEINDKYRRHVTVIPNGVDIPRLSENDAVLKRLDLAKQKYVLAVGRLVPEKGFDTLIKAFLSARLKDCKLVIAGDADHQDAYSRGLKEAAVNNQNIVLPGFLTGNDLGELYSHAGLFVLPSYYEGLPIALMEALGVGLACIASDIPGNRDLNLAGERYFKPGDEKALCEKLTEFASRPLTEKEMNEQVAWIASEYNWEPIARRTSAVYNKLMTKRCVKK